MSEKRLENTSNCWNREYSVFVNCGVGSRNKISESTHVYFKATIGFILKKVDTGLTVK